MILKLARPFFASAKFILLAILLSAGSMLLSFVSVRYVVRDMDVKNAVNPVELRRANVLRDYSNELAGLCNDYVRRIPAAPAAIPARERHWIDSVFRPEIQFLQHRMSDTIIEDSAEFTQIQSAVERCASMARHVDDTTLRIAALRDAARAVGAVEAWIEAKGLGRRLTRPALQLRFA